MVKLSQAVIVEGKYDKIKLQSLLDAVIITTNGFGIYKDKEKLGLIRAFAKNVGIIILTDSDSAGFQIRNFLKGAVGGKIYNIYIPEIIGKERRKIKPSAENKLGVEGMEIKILENAFRQAGIMTADENALKNPIFSRTMLFDDKLIGTDNSALLRAEVIKELNLPQNLSVTALIDVLNVVFTYEEYKNALNICINKKDK